MTAFCALCKPFDAFQELGELQEAKQLLIQQKLELQGQVEAAQSALEQEQKEHQATRDGRLQREEQLLALTREVQDKLVGPSASSCQKVQSQMNAFNAARLFRRRS